MGQKKRPRNSRRFREPTGGTAGAPTDDRWRETDDRWRETDDRWRETDDLGHETMRLISRLTG